MRKWLELPDVVEAGRVTQGAWGSVKYDGPNGAFVVMGPSNMRLRIIASSGTHPDAEGWEHVSVSAEAMNRCPNWPEMCFVKDLFWEPEETVIQFHPPRSEYVNHHPTTLHLWRALSWKKSPLPTPPKVLVGPVP